MTKDRRGFGQITKLPSSRFRARYTGPDGIRHPTPYTFETRGDAEAWLAAERRLLTDGAWLPPKQRATGVRSVTFGAYANRWLTARTLEARTRAHYRSLLDRHLLPRFDTVPLKHIRPDLVREAADLQPSADYDGLLEMRDAGDPRWHHVGHGKQLATAMYEANKTTAATVEGTDA